MSTLITESRSTLLVCAEEIPVRLPATDGSSRWARTVGLRVRVRARVSGKRPRASAAHECAASSESSTCNFTGRPARACSTQQTWKAS